MVMRRWSDVASGTTQNKWARAGRKQIKHLCLIQRGSPQIHRAWAKDAFSGSCGLLTAND